MAFHGVFGEAGEMRSFELSGPLVKRHSLACPADLEQRQHELARPSVRTGQMLWHIFIHHSREDISIIVAVICYSSCTRSLRCLSRLERASSRREPPEV